MAGMNRNSLTAENGRIRYVGRDFDLYFFYDDGAKMIVGSKAELDVKAQGGVTPSELQKMVGSTNCTFSSTANFETIADKSTPKNGKKQLTTIDWNFSSDNNIASVSDLEILLNAHQEGTEFYVSMSDQDPGNLIDDNGTCETGDGSIFYINGNCIITSIQINAQEGSLATFSMTLEGSGNYRVNSTNIGGTTSYSSSSSSSSGGTYTPTPSPGTNTGDGGDY